MLNRQTKIVAPFFLAFVVLTFLVRNNGFFWDSIVLGSGYAHWYYNTNFSELFVPDDIAGYPPIFGMYLALGWKVFGKTLPVSHFLMLPFILGTVIQAFKLVKRFVPETLHYWVLLLMLLEPTYLSQSTQIAPDLPLVLLYLLCLNYIIQHKRWQLAIALVFLAMLSPRGTILVAALFVTDLVESYLNTNNSFTTKHVGKRLSNYIPAFMITCLWLWLHYNHYGWVLYNPASEWGTGSEVVGLKGFAKNIAVIIWRFADLGKAVVYFLLLLILLWSYKKKLLNKDSIRLLLYALAPFVVLTSVVVFYQNPIAHRYYLVAFILLLLLFGHLLQYLTPLKRVITFSLSLIFLLAGHFVVMVYPESLSKGWDGTLAHLPYYQLRANMISYLDDHSIPLNEVGSAYPNLRLLELTDLNNRNEHFSEKNLFAQSLILQSNIFNDFTDEELSELKQNWEVKKEVREGGVYFRLYQKRL